ncbi:hypothetical protein C1637_24980 [Chryseobacterium lactis]|uniref:Uncharacterized protein n=2 Tax=Chryseobacterium lactis TaxID=1241981 RepID=A0A3G6RM92_CHRLC|nr:hypothetical protein EG342_12125 [Chryseobacterium lactis]AZB02976.1 hypothetical protein EG341_02985 [Chryseobacterium lactis]PNW10964.1 hypothetical protein C1637_24980 [Chryseobacterium lactis]
MITLVEIYWSMGALSNQISSGCMTCSFLEDALMMAFFTGIFLSVVFALLYKVKKFFIKAIIEFLLLVILWFFWNYSIFVDRESSWSTYDLRSEMYYTITLSLFPVILLGSVCILLLNYRNVFQKNKN